MVKSLRLVLKVSCWMAVAALTVATMLYLWEVKEILAQVLRHPSKSLYCGNTITGYLEEILEIGTPIGMVAIAVLFAIERRRNAAIWSYWSAIILTIASTTSLIVFGEYFFQLTLPSFHLSDIIWWMI